MASPWSPETPFMMLPHHFAKPHMSLIWSPSRMLLEPQPISPRAAQWLEGLSNGACTLSLETSFKFHNTLTLPLTRNFVYTNVLEKPWKSHPLAEQQGTQLNCKGLYHKNCNTWIMVLCKGINRWKWTS